MQAAETAQLERALVYAERLSRCASAGGLDEAAVSAFVMRELVRPLHRGVANRGSTD